MVAGISMFSASLAHDYVEEQRRPARAMRALDAIERAEAWLNERMEAEARNPNQYYLVRDESWLQARTRLLDGIAVNLRPHCAICERQLLPA